MDRKTIRISEPGIEKKLETLRSIYNMKADSKLVSHLVDLELKRHGL